MFNFIKNMWKDEFADAQTKIEAANAEKVIIPKWLEWAKNNEQMFKVYFNELNEAIKRKEKWEELTRRNEQLKEYKMQTYYGKDHQYWIYLISIKDKLSLIDATCKFENIVIWNYTKLLNYENKNRNEACFSTFEYLFNKKEPNKMTREEAISIIERKTNVGYDKVNAKEFLNTLEALGLIKFDEPVKEPSPVEKGLTLVLGTTKYVDLLKWLYDHGYHIVRNHSYNFIKTDGTKA